MGINKNWYWLAGFIVVGLLLGVGVLLLITRPHRGSPITLLPAPSPSPLTVYVTGEVNQAGLYSFPPGSRVNDAIQAAGGLSINADNSAINLARILEDGDQIDVPGLITNPVSEGSTRSVNPGLSLVDINTATLEQLDTLPGIGPVTAQGIIDYRTSKGAFSSIEEINDVPGIGQVTFDKIKDLITVGTPP